MIAYIYGLTDPDTDGVRYVGASAKPDVRYDAHLSRISDESDRSARNTWIRSVIDAGKKPGMKILEVVLADTVSEKEKQWINRLRAAGVDLVNVQYMPRQRAHSEGRCEMNPEDIQQSRVPLNITDQQGVYSVQLSESGCSIYLGHTMTSGPAANMVGTVIITLDTLPRIQAAIDNLVALSQQEAIQHNTAERLLRNDERGEAGS